MADFRNREEVVNTQLANLITDMGITADAEKVLSHGKHRPDVMFQLRGLRVVIEGKFDDNVNAKETVMKDARNRVRNNIAHIAIALVYPDELRTATTSKITNILKKAKLEFCIITETFESEAWSTGTPQAMMEEVRRAQESLIEDDIVEKTASGLLVHLENIASLWSDHTGSCDRLSKLLGISIPENEEAAESKDRRESAAKISALVLSNAFIFQEQLSLNDGRVDTLKKLKGNVNLLSKVMCHWKWIAENINYVSIFQLGEEILAELPESGNPSLSIRSLIDEAQQICSEQASLRHDLMGRIYHWLLHDAKYLGTYYTSVSAATLLLKVALNLDWNTDFGDPRGIAEFKVADLASGTGTLLMAATQALTDNYIKSRVKSDNSIEEHDLSTLHKALMENCIHGYDILPSAVHLTASTLALLSPDVAFRRMNLYVMPIGIDHGTVRLGSLDFLTNTNVPTQLSLDKSHLETVQQGVDEVSYTSAKVPELDLCVMNPPFVSSRGDNLLFGSHPEHRKQMQSELKSRVKKTGVSVTPGLGAVFVPLADKCTKKGGRIAFVLPIAIATGMEWGKVRNYIADRYHLEVVITSHDSNRTNFSENTDLSEILFIARKLKNGEKAGNTFFVTLRNNPVSIHDALNTASRISVAIMECTQQSSTKIIQSAGKILGEVSSSKSPVAQENWTRAIFLQSYLANVFTELEVNHKLKIPGHSSSTKFPLCTLENLGEIGYDVRDITDAFEVDKTATHWTPYEAFWNHKSGEVVQITQKFNSYLIPRSNPIPGRKLKDPKAIWQKSGDILLVSRVRTNTHRILAAKFSKKIVGNTWWAFNSNNLTNSEKKALLLWLNSTLGALILYGRRAITEGPWIKMNKQSWNEVKVLNVKKLSKSQISKLEMEFDKLARRKLDPLSQLENDQVRIAIDHAICSNLKLPMLNEVRSLLSNEPGFTG